MSKHSPRPAFPHTMQLFRILCNYRLLGSILCSIEGSFNTVTYSNFENNFSYKGMLQTQRSFDFHGESIPKESTLRAL